MRPRPLILCFLGFTAVAAAGDGASSPAAAAKGAGRERQLSELSPSTPTDRPPAEPAQPELRYIASRAVVLAYAVDEAVPVDAVELWFRRTPDQPWAPVEFEAMRPGCLTYNAPDDGPYDFYLILRNAGGASAPPPTATAAPHARIMVDTVPPVVQIHRAQVRSLAAMDRRLSVELTASDEHLGPAGVRLFYRPAETESAPSRSPDSAQTDLERGNDLEPFSRPEDVAPWRDGGAVEVRDRGFKWPLPDDLPDRLDLRIVVADLAGNQAADERHAVPTVLVSPNGEPPAESAGVAEVAPAEDGVMAHVERVEVPMVTPVAAPGDASAEAAHAAAEVDGRAAPPDPADADAKAASQEARRMAEIAARHLRAREYDLAAARFRDGLKLVPNDPDLLTGLGGVLYRMEQFEDAAAQFGSALLAEPEHVGALEGYALVEATQRRYPEARKRLGQLLRLQPRSARHWLHLGDIEHKLGNTREALDAWQKAVDLESAPPEIVEQGRKRLRYFSAAVRP